jgi:hypothetical protein
MLFLKGKEKTSQTSSGENPRPPRYSAVARVRINGFEGEAVLRNISIGGFRMESKTYAAITVGEHYAIQIIPEAIAMLNLIEMEVAARWIQSAETSFNSGFLIITANQSFEKYVDYISHKSTL